jgi:hypothetical protein
MGRSWKHRGSAFVSVQQHPLSGDGTIAAMTRISAFRHLGIATVPFPGTQNYGLRSSAQGPHFSRGIVLPSEIHSGFRS